MKIKKKISVKKWEKLLEGARKMIFKKIYESYKMEMFANEHLSKATQQSRGRIHNLPLWSCSAA